MNYNVTMEVERVVLVNLGIGIPTLCPSFIPTGVTVHVQNENGIIGVVSAHVSFILRYAVYNMLTVTASYLSAYVKRRWYVEQGSVDAMQTRDPLP